MLKGTATIELTNVNTGEKEVYKHDNLVTNAVNDILTMNPRLRYYFGDGARQQGIVPIVPNLIGGILLYKDTLEENATKYYAPDTNELIGYSSNVVNTTADPKRGSMNQTESQQIDNGYKFVFDFQTSQGNGLISSLGLTSKWGGLGGYGSEYEQQPLLYWGDEDISVSSLFDFVPFRWISGYDEATDTFISVHVSGINTLCVQRIKAKLKNIDLFVSYGYRNADIISKEYITTTTFGNNYSVSYQYYDFLDDKINNCIWGLYTPSNSSGDATVTWIKINKNNLSIEEGTWTFSETYLYRFGYSYYGSENDFTSSSSRISYCIIKDNFLYCCNYDQTGIYKINLSNFEDIKLIPGNITIAPTDSNSNNGEQNCTNITFNTVGNIIYFRKGYIFNDIIYSMNNFTNGLYNNATPSLTSGPFVITPYHYYYSSSSSPSRRIYDSVYLATPYLATINNLETPIEKTSDKTMKITYILTESEE